jgi:hypothetical protein
MPNVSKRMRSIDMAKMKILKNKALVFQQTAVNSCDDHPRGCDVPPSDGVPLWSHPGDSRQLVLLS